MSDLKEKIALVLAKWLGETGTVSPQFCPIADDILSIPEIAEALAVVGDIRLALLRGDDLVFTNAEAKAAKLVSDPPSDLGHSITVHRD